MSAGQGDEGAVKEGSFDGPGADDVEEDKRARLRLRNREAQRRLRQRKRAAAQEAAKTLEEVEDAISRAEDANEQLNTENSVLEKAIAVREEFIAAVQHLQQLDLAAQAGEAAAKDPLPPEVQELTAMSPAQFAAQMKRWNRTVKTLYQLAEASGWGKEATEELTQHVAYLVAIFQAVTLTAPNNVLAILAATTEQSTSVAEDFLRWQQVAASLDATPAQLAELRSAHDTYLRRMGRLIATRNVAYAGVEQAPCPSPSEMCQGRLSFSDQPPPPSSPPLGSSPSLANLSRFSSELQRSVEQVNTTYKTEYHVVNDLLDSIFAILSPRQLARLVAMSDPHAPDYLQVLCCLMNSTQQQPQRRDSELAAAGAPAEGPSQVELQQAQQPLPSLSQPQQPQQEKEDSGRGRHPSPMQGVVTAAGPQADGRGESSRQQQQQQQQQQEQQHM